MIMKKILLVFMLFSFSISAFGQAVLSAVANDVGSATIHIGALSPGIYLVNYNEITIKFIKQ